MYLIFSISYPPLSKNYYYITEISAGQNIKSNILQLEFGIVLLLVIKMKWNQTIELEYEIIFFIIIL